jgi:hypothetical protein
MGHIYTYDEINQEFEGRGYILVTDHKLKCDEKYEYICKKHQDKGSQFIDWGHFHSSRRGCKYCGLEKCGNARKKDLSEYDGESLAISKGFEYVGMSRHDKKVWVQFICPKHRQYGVQEMPYNNMKRVVVGCQHCIGRNDNEEEVLQEMFAANPNIELLEPYKGRRKPTRMKCTIHNIEMNKPLYEVIAGRGCVKCGAEKLSQFASTPIDIYLKELHDKYDCIELISGYTSKSNYAKFHCNKCGNDWMDIALYVAKRGCPICHGTSMELKIGEILQTYNIEYIPQFSFQDCKDQRPLPFDFYLPSQNILIEYDGEQHFRPVNFGGIPDERAIKNLTTTQYHDKIKTSYCKEHNIPLIRIPYWDKNNIEEILMSQIRIGVNINN